MNTDLFFDPFPILTTRRLRLRPLTLDDAAAMFEVFSDAEAMAYYGPDVPHQTVERTAALIQELQNYEAGRDSIRWGITLKEGPDKVIGTLGVYKFDQAAACCELGYELHRAYWGQGIMSEAVRCVLDFAFDEVGFRRIEAGTDNDNPRSQALLRKLGFKHEGCFRQKLYYKGQYWDENWFGLLISEYKRSS